MACSYIYIFVIFFLSFFGCIINNNNSVQCRTTMKKKKNNATNIVYDLFFVYMHKMCALHSLAPKCSGGLINTCTSLKEKKILQQNEKSTAYSVCELATKAENTNCLFDNNNNSNTHIVYSDANNLTILQLYNFYTERY